MGDSMSTIINATTTNGVVIQPDNSGSLVLQTNSGTTAVTIDTSQNVGIGTTSPATKLNITKDGNTYAVLDAFEAQQISHASIAYSRWIQGSGIANLCGVDTEKGIFGTSSNHPLAIRTNNTERMRIDSSGNVSVGTASAGKFNVTYDGSSAVPKGSIFNNVEASATSRTYIEWQRAGGAVASITGTNTTITYGTSSDYRLKENVTPMVNALDTVSKLNPVTYKWKVDGSNGQGFIAHELQEYFPDAVQNTKDEIDAEGNPVYQGIDTSFLVATLTAAIQEQQTIINDLKARVETLEAK